MRGPFKATDKTDYLISSHAQTNSKTLLRLSMQIQFHFIMYTHQTRRTENC